MGTSLHQNVVDCMLSLLTAARSFGYADFSFDQLRPEAMLQAHEETDRITPELAERIGNLFHSEMIQKTFDRRAEFWLLDSLPYYIKHLARFCEPDFVPTEEDSVGSCAVSCLRGMLHGHPSAPAQVHCVSLSIAADMCLLPAATGTDRFSPGDGAHSHDGHRQLGAGAGRGEERPARARHAQVSGGRCGRTEK